MSIIESVREYITSCPELADGNINVDFLSSEELEYTIETVPCDPIIKYYIGGSSLRQYEFILASRELFGADTAANIQNSTFYEKFANWVEANNKNNVFPLLTEGRKPQKIEILTHGCLLTEDAKTAVYQIQLRLIYIQEG